MKHLTLLVLIAVLALGCDPAGKQIVSQKTTPGQMALGPGLMPSEKLLERGSIDAHRKIAGADGVEIDAWIINADQPPPLGTVLILHGSGESKWKYLGMGRNLASRGYDVILMDLRSHGLSGGEYMTYGAKEKLDARAVLEAAIAEQLVKAEPIYLLGVNLGGATAIQLAAMDPKIAGVVAVAPWKDTATAARRKLGLTAASETDFADALAEAGRLGDFDPQTTSAVLDAQKVSCPVYLVHGLIDLAVPLSDSQAIESQLAGPGQLKVITPGPEQMIVVTAWDAWLPEQLDKLAKGKLPEAK